MKSLSLKGWTAWRLIRFLLGLFFIAAGLYRSDFILAAGGLYIGALSLFNLGCSGGSCSV